MAFQPIIRQSFEHKRLVHQRGDRIALCERDEHAQLWDGLARSGVGTVIGKKSVSKGREYERVWIYVPTKVSEDSSFPFKIGDPCLVQLDTERKQLLLKRIGREEAVKLGWRAERKRRTG